MGNKITFLIFLVSLIFNCAEIKAQLFSEKRFYPGVKTIISKYSGSFSRGYWTKSNLDSQGRCVLEESYKRNKLLSKEKITYNSNDDVVLKINENLKTNDTARYIYLYNNLNQITYQCYRGRYNDSTIYQLIDKKYDSLLIYKNTRFTKDGRVLSTIYLLTFDLNDRILEFVEENEFVNSPGLFQYNTIELKGIAKVITKYSYDSNANRITRKIVRIPEYIIKGVYCGGPSSDDMGFSYRYDRKNRIKKQYNMVNGKRYKIATYKYKF